MTTGRVSQVFLEAASSFCGARPQTASPSSARPTAASWRRRPADCAVHKKCRAQVQREWLGQEPPAAARVRARAALPPPLPQNRADQRAGQPQVQQARLLARPCLWVWRPAAPRQGAHARRLAARRHCLEPRHWIHLLRSRRRILPIVGRDDDRRSVLRPRHRAGGGERWRVSTRSASRSAEALPGGAEFGHGGRRHVQARGADRRRARRRRAPPPTSRRARASAPRALPSYARSCRRRITPWRRSRRRHRPRGTR